MKKEETRIKIQKIQKELSIKTIKMAKLLDMNPQSYRNCLSAQNPTNNFKDINFKELKAKIIKSIHQAFLK